MEIFYSTNMRRQHRGCQELPKTEDRSTQVRSTPKNSIDIVQLSPAISTINQAILIPVLNYTIMLYSVLRTCIYTHITPCSLLTNPDRYRQQILPWITTAGSISSPSIRLTRLLLAYSIVCAIPRCVHVL